MFMLALGARLFRCACFRNGPGISKGYRGGSKNDHLPCLSFHRDASTRMSNPGKGVADRSHRRASPSPHLAQAGCRHSGVNPVVSHTSSHLPPCRSDEDRPSPSGGRHSRPRTRGFSGVYHHRFAFLSLFIHHLPQPHVLSPGDFCNCCARDAQSVSTNHGRREVSVCK